MFLLLVIIYLAFISLGLPDSVLGSAWPVMSADLKTTVAFAGVISFVINAGTVTSSLLSTRVIHHFGTGKVVAISVLLTALALYGFALAQNTWVLVLLAVPLGLGAGAVDAALNNFVALHYQSKHMNFLHSFWGLGATAGPLIMAAYLGQHDGWRSGYSTIAYIQLALVFVLFSTLSLWRKASNHHPAEGSDASHLISNRMALKIKGVKLQLLLFFCYCSLEAGTGLWAASFLIFEQGVSATSAAFWTAMYYTGITAGRFGCGFIADRVDERKMIQAGVITILAGVVLLLQPLSATTAKFGLILIGLGCAPVYPNTIHLTPVRFGQQASQAIIGLSMATAYVGTTLMPFLIGVVATSVSFFVLPVVLLLFAGLMLFSSQKIESSLYKTVYSD